MILKTNILISDSVNPWENLSIEEYLLDTVSNSECYLYLWQNANTVVIGKNQNPWQECKTELLENEGGKLARRISGGGAVYHDLGNLNFTFVMPKEDYDYKRQSFVILGAVKSLGIDAEMSGRNDLTVDGKKFSGNAFCHKKNASYHHGTILVSADIEKMGRYLQASADKLQSKGVKSVKARVTNLNEYIPNLSIDDMKEALISSFIKEYNVPNNYLAIDSIPKDNLEGLIKKNSSWDFLYGSSPESNLSLQNRFTWGNIDMHLFIDEGIIKKATIYSDAMDTDFIEHITKKIINLPFSYKNMIEAVRSMDIKYNESINDICTWLETQV